MNNTAKDEVLKIENIHLHWCFKDSTVSLFINFIKVTSEAEAVSETFNVKMNDDVFTFFMLNLCQNRA